MDTTRTPAGWRRFTGRPLLAVAATVLTGALGLVGVVPAANASPAPASTPSAAAPATEPTAEIPECALSDLPPEASDTLGLVRSGGPFPYPEDGTVFENREGILPDESEGYYREYTVETPGSDDRGARRLVGGGEEPTQPDNVYYTDDHYESFCLITEEGGGSPEDPGGMAECPLGNLPGEVSTAVDSVPTGDVEGVPYENREGHLAEQPEGYYTVYAVGDSADQRLVAGGGDSSAPQEMYYTDDHYASFCAVTEA